MKSTGLLWILLAFILTGNLIGCKNRNGQGQEDNANHDLQQIKDSNELVNLSEATTADSSLDETIKSEEANQSVANKYQEEADNSMDDQINHYPIPYCAVY